MIELFSKDRINARLQSSKGNQLKFSKGFINAINKTEDFNC